jgi:hypothetical protein
MEVELDYSPRIQFEPFHIRRQRFACIVAHRRAGKTVACVHELIIRALHTPKKNARYGYIAPFRQQAKNIAWVYLKEATRKFAISIRESDLRVELPNGAWISLYGSDNPDALRGVYFDGIVIDEFGDCRPSLWAEVIIPTLADREGWAVVIGTPKGKNQFWEFWELSKKDDRWFSLTLKASQTGIISKSELDQMRSVMSDAQYAQELECSFEAPVLGTYYAGIINMMEIKGQIGPGACKYDPIFPVHAVGDLGYTDSCAWWFWQPRPDGIAIIDYEEAHSQPLQYYFDLLENKGYEYETIWLPHDARAKTLQTGKSTVEQFLIEYKEKCNIDIVPQLKVQHGIDALRLTLPNCYINSETCNDGIEALRAYRRQFNEDRKAFSDKPLHDWSSHGSDSARYMALVCKDKLKVKLPQKIIEEVKKIEQQTYNFNLNQLFAELDKSKLGNQRRRI